MDVAQLLVMPGFGISGDGDNNATTFDFEQGNYSTFAEVSADVYRITPRQHWNSNWLWWAVKSGKFSGKTPHFLIAKASKFGGVNNVGERTCVWATSLDTDTWNDFDNNAVGADDYEFYNDTAFPSGIIYIASLPIYNYTRCLRVFNAWLEDARATDLTDTTLLTPRATSDGRTAPALPILAMMITNDSGYTKNKMVLTGGNHPNETTGRLALEGFMTWLLAGSPEAEYLLDWWEIYVYPCINPQGVWAGYFRSSPQTTTSDNNRLWDTTGDNEAVDLVKTRMAADTGGTIEAGFDFHSSADLTVWYLSVYDGTVGIYPILDTKLDGYIAHSYATETTVTSYMRRLWRDTYSAAIAATFEIGGAISKTLANIKTEGQYLGQALAAMQAEQRFTNGEVGARRFNGTTDRIDRTLAADLTGQPVTISVWVKLGRTTGDQYIVNLGLSTGAAGIYLANLNTTTGPGSWQLSRKGTTSLLRYVALVLDTTSWVHLLAEHDGTFNDATKIKMYRNGAEETYTAGTNGATETSLASGIWSIGGRQSDDLRNTQMDFAQLGVWNRLLTPTEKANLALGYSPALAAPTNLISYLKGNTSELHDAKDNVLWSADGTSQLTGVGTGPAITYG